MAVEGAAVQRRPSALERSRVHVGSLVVEQPLADVRASAASGHVQQLSAEAIADLVAVVALEQAAEDRLRVARLGYERDELVGVLSRATLGRARLNVCEIRLHLV